MAAAATDRLHEQQRIIFLPGQDAGFLGAAFEPFIAGDPSRQGYRVPGLNLPKELSLGAFGRQRSLLEAVDRILGDGPAVDGLDAHYRRAYALISSPEARRAFRLGARAHGRSRAVRPRPGQPTAEGGPPVRRPAAPGPMPVAGLPSDRGRRQGGHRL